MNPEVSLKLVRTLGGVEVQDDNYAFHNPRGVASNDSGEIFVLDYGNNRIQKFSPEGKYLATIGRRGQGPGEFEGPLCFDIDPAGSLYVFEGASRRIQILAPNGKARQTIKNTKASVLGIRYLPSGMIAVTGYPSIAFTEKKLQPLPKLMRVLDPKGNLKFEFGDLHDFSSNIANTFGNYPDFDVDLKGNFFVTFRYENRIEKYFPEGKLVWRANRPLNYDTKPISPGSMKRTAQGLAIIQPQLNSVSTGIAVDARGRAWVATLDRQLTQQEEGEVVTTPGFRKVKAAADSERIDAYKLEIYDPEGMLLGELKLDHRMHGLRICKDFLFIWESNFDRVYQYEIAEKK